MSKKPTLQELDASVKEYIDNASPDIDTSELVTSVNGKKGDVTISIPTNASDIGALPLGVDGAVIDASGDWNDYTDTGFYKGVDLLNSPSNVVNEWGWWYVLVMKHADAWIIQHAWNLHSGRQLTRLKLEGVWQPWQPASGVEIDNNPVDITYYVRTTGNDSNDGTTEATAFKTFGKAMTMWKTFTLGGKRIFDIGAGVDLTPDLTPNHREWRVKYKWGGDFEFNFNNAHSLVPQFDHIQSRVLIKNFTRYHSAITGSWAIGESCYFDNCYMIDVDNVIVDFSKRSPEGWGANVWAFQFSNKTRGRVGSATFTKVNNGVLVGDFSYAFIYNLKGTADDSYATPLSANNGSIIDCLMYSGISGATKKYEVASGGQVFGVS